MCIRDSADGDGTVGVALLVEAEHSGVVHFIDMVAGEDQHVVRVIAFDERDILIDGVGRALDVYKRQTLSLPCTCGSELTRFETATISEMICLAR